jgi:hypothetical protein
MARVYEDAFPVYEAYLLQDMDNAITECNLWDWLKTFEADGDKGFLFTLDPNIDKIMATVKHQGHSGFSFAWCMRHMQAVAKKGWPAHKLDVLKMSRST